MRATTLWVGTLLLACVAAACSGGTRMQPDAAFGSCTSDSDCNDNATCTIDQCDVNMMCQHTPIDAMCTGGQTCQPFVGCTSMQTCSSNAQCDDSIACTVDGCSSAHVCTHMAVDALCASTPATPVCDTTMGCVAGSSTTCRSMADCDDMVACTVDSCGVDMMCHHTTVDASCPMGQRCTATGCVMMHACTTAANCMDPSFWNFCDGDPVCSTEFGCMNPSPRMCDDGNPCTLDSCDPAAGANGQCVTACDTSMGAACATDPACAVPGPTCAGRFMLSPPPMGNCGGALGAVWDLSQITITNMGGALTITPNHLSSSMTLMSAPGMCPDFTATRTINGGCQENYMLTGSFSDDNTFTGMFSATFVETDGISCRLAGCGGTFNYSFTGTRI